MKKKKKRYLLHSLSYSHFLLVDHIPHYNTHAVDKADTQGHGQDHYRVLQKPGQTNCHSTVATLWQHCGNTVTTLSQHCHNTIK